VIDRQPILTQIPHHNGTGSLRAALAAHVLVRAALIVFLGMSAVMTTPCTARWSQVTELNLLLADDLASGHKVVNICSSRSKRRS
jgi:hypothetical protein